MRNDVDAELDRQCETLLRLGYPDLLRVPADRLTTMVDALRPAVRDAVGPEALVGSPSRVPFVLVAQATEAANLVPLLRLLGGIAEGKVDPNHGTATLDSYRPLPDLHVPEADVYVVVDVERGEEFRGRTPRDAVQAVRGRGRTPLTIHEGIALVTQFPGTLEKNRCFMLAGSRRGDRRVPALWISHGAPKLGWCWEGNPHDWLGTASARSRVDAT